MTAQAPWLLPCGCVKAAVRSPLDHRPDCPTLRPDPQAFNLTAAAEWVTVVLDDPTLGESHRITARTLWERLVGLHGEEAAAYARRLAGESRPLFAHLTPF